MNNMNKKDYSINVGIISVKDNMKFLLKNQILYKTIKIVYALNLMKIN